MMKLLPPFELDVLTKLANAVHDITGIEYHDTVTWLAQHKTPESLLESMRQLWRPSDLPIRLWCDKIRSVCAVYDEEHAEFGIMIQVADLKLPFMIQQAPLEQEFCKRRLVALTGAIDPILLDLFTTAPGLRMQFGPVLALPDFLKRPADTMAQAACGPSMTVDQSLHCDVQVFTRDHMAFEMIWDATRFPEYGFIVISRDLRTFVYYTDETIGLDECDWNINRLVDRFFEMPDDILREALRNLKRKGETIHFVQAGRDARLAYGKLEKCEKTVVALREALRLTPRRMNSTARNQLLNVLVSCKNSILSGNRFDNGLISSLEDLLDPSKWRSEVPNESGEAVSVAMYVLSVIKAWLNNADPPYPDYRLRDMSHPPVYASILNDIDRLKIMQMTSANESIAKRCQNLLSSDL